MASLFDVTTINTITLRNRFVRSATWEGMAGADGSMTEKIVDMYSRQAEGGIGLIITGHTYVSKEGQAVQQQLGLHRDGLIGGFADLTRAVHERGARIIVQLSHAGCRADVGQTGVEPIGPSVLKGEQGQVCRAMMQDDIDCVAEAFSDAAERAKKAGFDGVQIHGAHSYLLSEFLSPCHNARRDRYGGSVENRARMLLDVVAAVRGRLGHDGLLSVKINSDDFIEGGFVKEDMLAVCPLLGEAGVDAIELSGGSPFSPKWMATRPGPILSEADEVYYREAAVLYKQRVNVPLILPGGIRSYGVAQKLVEEGITDYISMSRPLIREPGLINRWKAGDLRKAACLTDNLCLGTLRTAEGLCCVVERKARAGKAGKTS
jgi:2,4-dienoyl-CoA reductase-like NADH-dependent reductase (Old Yellow Enzyme family)